MSFLNFSISLLISLGTMVLVAQLIARILQGRPVPKPILIKSQRGSRQRKY